ncbi:hypothetical protein ABIA25_000515 [Sinorhizobium fredii]
MSQFNSDYEYFCDISTEGLKPTCLPTTSAGTELEQPAPQTRQSGLFEYVPSLRSDQSATSNVSFL